MKSHAWHISMSTLITLYYGVIAEHTLVGFVFSYARIYVEDNMKIRSIARGRLSGLKHPLGLEVILVKPPNLRYWYMGIATILHVPRRGEWATPCANYMSTPSFAKIRKGSRPRQWCFFRALSAMWVRPAPFQTTTVLTLSYMATET